MPTLNLASNRLERRCVAARRLPLGIQPSPRRTGYCVIGMNGCPRVCVRQVEGDLTPRCQFELNETCPRKRQRSATRFLVRSADSLNTSEAWHRLEFCNQTGTRQAKISSVV